MSYDYGALAASGFSEVVHGPSAIDVTGAKELVVLIRTTARVVGTGSIQVIVRQVFPADDDASDIVGTDLITLTIGTPPIGQLGTTTTNIPSHVRVLTRFNQGGTVGALLLRHMVRLIARDR
jgi:hypothetical protein